MCGLNGSLGKALLQQDSWKVFLSHLTMGILVHVGIEVIDLLSYSVYFILLLQNVIGLQKSLLVVDVVEKAQQPDIETK